MKFKRLGPGWYLSEDRRVELRQEATVASGGIRFWEVWVDGKKVGYGETKEEAVASLGRRGQVGGEARRSPAGLVTGPGRGFDKEITEGRL